MDSLSADSTKRRTPRQFPHWARQTVTLVGVVSWILSLLLGSIGTAAEPALAAGITLTPVGIPFNTPISVDYEQLSNKLLLSVNYASGQPNNFDLVAADGTFSQFSSIKGLTDEVYIATIRSSACTGGFTIGDAFTGTGVGGQIARISGDGLTTQIPWVTLPGETGLLRGGLVQDQYCDFAGNLIVDTENGDVWKITSAGVPTEIAKGVAPFLEGITTIPNNSAVYGPWAGKILVGDEQNGCVYTVDGAGTVTPYCSLGLGQPETMTIIPANQNFYGVDYGDGHLDSAGAAQWTPYVGDVEITSESPGYLWDVHWNGSTFQPTLLAQVSQWEGSNFAPVSLPNVSPSCNLTAVIAGPPKQLQITVQDTGTGLAASPNGIVVTGVNNATVNIPTYNAGSTSAVVVTATKINQSQGASVALRVTDVAGNVTNCDPAMLTLRDGSGQSSSQTINNLGQAEHMVSIHTGTNGLTSATIAVNGTTFGTVNLTANSTKTVNVAALMHAGNANSITISGTGAVGATAGILIWGPATH